MKWLPGTLFFELVRHDETVPLMTLLLIRNLDNLKCEFLETRDNEVLISHYDSPDRWYFYRDDIQFVKPDSIQEYSLRNYYSE